LVAFQLLAGGGAVEVALASKIAAYGEKCPGLEQYAIKAFASALEVFPKQLAENAGLKVDILYLIFFCEILNCINFYDLSKFLG
jgi:chaperonin GroEL (HSP60 family)